MAPVVYGFYPWLNTFVMLENTIEGSWLVAPSLSSSYLYGLKFHQLYLAIGMIGKWNKLHNLIVLQDNTFQHILYIIGINHS